MQKVLQNVEERYTQEEDAFDQILLSSPQKKKTTCNRYLRQLFVRGDNVMLVQRDV